MKHLFLLFLSLSPFFLVPHYTDCSPGCSSWSYWNGTTYGVSVNFRVDNPPQNSSYAYEDWDRLAIVWNYSYKVGSIVIGLEKAKTATGYCQSTSGNLFYIVEAFDDQGTHIWSYCVGVSSADVGHQALFWIKPYTSNGGGMLVQIFDYLGNHIPPQYIPYADGVHHSFSTITYKEDIYDYVQGHYIVGGEWTNSAYVHSDGTSVYQSRGVDGLTSRNPPQMFWHVDPAPGNNGGDMYSCDYDVGSYNCVPGS